MSALNGASCLALVVVAVALAPTANAETVTFNFTGTVTSASGIWAGQGGTVTGTYSYDDGLVDANPSAFTDFFRDDAPVANQALSGWGITVTVGAVTRSTSTNANIPGTFHHFIEVLDSGGEDRFRVGSIRRTPSDDMAELLARDFVPLVADGIAVGSGNLTNTVPLGPINIPLFSSTFGLSSYSAYDAQGNLEGSLRFTLTGTSVPEPTGLALVGLGLATLAAGRRRRAANR